MKKPIIGISQGSLILSASLFGVRRQEIPDYYHILNQKFVDMLIAEGAVPLILPSNMDIEGSKLLWDKLDGVLFSGGSDVNPMTYGQRIHDKLGGLDNVRDHYELELIDYILEKDLPFLGICRGIQILNVAMGGSLYQDLQSAGFYKHDLHNLKHNETSHYVELVKDSKLYEIIKEEKVGVNSYHHQAIDKLAQGLVPTAFSEDELIEAVEVRDKKFALAVQRHPEQMQDSESMRNLVRSFVEACSK